jgi:multiple sugar transport system substrate-binding protein
VATVSDTPDLPQARFSRRTLIRGIAATGALALLSACGGKSTATTAAAATCAVPAGTAPVKVTWFASRDTSGYTPQQVDAFNKACAGIQIDYQEQGATTQDLHDKFVTVAQAKDPAADIVSMDVPYVPEFAAAGWTIATDTVLSKDELGKFFKGTLDGATYNGKLYALPWFNNGPGLYYRKDLLEAKGLKAPKTYDELLAAAKAVQTADIAGFGIQLPQSEGGIISWMEYLWGYGGNLVDDKLKVVVDEGTAGVDGMQKLLDFVYKDKIIPEAALQFKLGADVMNLFRTGKAAMIRLWFSNAGDLYKPDTTIKPEQWDVAPLPSKDGAKAGPGCLGTWNLGVAVASKKQAAALEAIKLLVNQDNQKARMMGNGNLPTRLAVFDDAEVQKKYPYAKSAQASFEFLKPRPVTPFYPEISANAIQPAFGQAMAKQITADQAIKQMADKMRSIIKV